MSDEALGSLEQRVFREPAVLPEIIRLRGAQNISLYSILPLIVKHGVGDTLLAIDTRRALRDENLLELTFFDPSHFRPGYLRQFPYGDVIAPPHVLAFYMLITGMPFSSFGKDVYVSTGSIFVPERVDWRGGILWTRDNVLEREERLTNRLVTQLIDDAMQQGGYPNRRTLLHQYLANDGYEQLIHRQGLRQDRCVQFLLKNLADPFITALPPQLPGTFPNVREPNHFAIVAPMKRDVNACRAPYYGMHAFTATYRGSAYALRTNVSSQTNPTECVVAGVPRRMLTILSETTSCARQ